MGQYIPQKQRLLALSSLYFQAQTGSVITRMYSKCVKHVFIRSYTDKYIAK